MNASDPLGGNEAEGSAQTPRPGVNALVIVGFLAVWVVMQLWLLPKAGVGT